MGSVQDEHHVLFVCPALGVIRSQFPRLFGDAGRFTHVQRLFQVDANSDQDWSMVIRDTCRYLEIAGGIFKPLLAVPQINIVETDN